MFLTVCKFIRRKYVMLDVWAHMKLYLPSTFQLRIYWKIWGRILKTLFRLLLKLIIGGILHATRIILVIWKIETRSQSFSLIVNNFVLLRDTIDYSKFVKQSEVLENPTGQTEGHKIKCKVILKEMSTYPKREVAQRKCSWKFTIKCFTQ